MIDNATQKFIQASAEVTYVPDIPADTKLHYQKIPLTQIAALGTAFSPLITSFQAARQAVGNAAIGGEGLYRVTFNGKAGALARAKDGSGFLGNVINPGHGVNGLARLKPAATSNVFPMVYNPTMLFMGLALISIDQKLNAIQETQREILDYLRGLQVAQIQTDLDNLNSILTGYRYNWQSEKFITTKLIVVQDVKRDAKKNIAFYRNQIQTLNDKKQWLHFNRDLDERSSKLQECFKYYRMVMYLYAFSAFVETLLLENFDAGYLNHIVDNIQSYEKQYGEDYEKCYTKLESYANSSVESSFLSGAAHFNKKAAKMIAKNTFFNQGPIDEMLASVGEQLDQLGKDNTIKTMTSFQNNHNKDVEIFVDKLQTLNVLHNQPTTLLFDDKNVYIDDSQK
ncbi:hypothetical protein [Pseudoramibacter faecis]|uniref:hypothetical protein n=1 Tax=Pseudoramibacter faecis TaxID=3108534 RepID=UPI002E75EE80|nr:hypothetical protein [Pseudoramibacter sp. HA2172]